MLTENQLDRDILNMLEKIDSEILRDEAEEMAFERAIRNWEIEGIFDDTYGFLRS